MLMEVLFTTMAISAKPASFSRPEDHWSYQKLMQKEEVSITTTGRSWAVKQLGGTWQMAWEIPNLRRMPTKTSIPPPLEPRLSFSPNSRPLLSILVSSEREQRMREPKWRDVVGAA